VVQPLALRIHFVPTSLFQQEKDTKAAKAMEAVGIQVIKEAGAMEAKPAAASAGAKAAKYSKAAKEEVAEAKVSLSQCQCLTPAHLSVRERLVNWELAKAPVDVLQVIQEGVLASWPCPHLSLWPTVRSQGDIQKVLPLVAEYVAAGALQEVAWGSHIKFLIPWFILTKREPSGELKHRLISDCRLLNQHLSPPQFRLENIQMVFPVLRKGMFGVKVDLKNAYFHLGVAEVAKPYLCMQVGEKYYQWQEAPFGLSILPYLFQRMMSTLLKKWRAAGLLVWVYLDDILVVNANQKVLQKEVNLVLKDLGALGLNVNTKKSVLQPNQNIQYLGFTLNFKEGTLEVPQQKLKTVRRELGKLVTHTHLSPRKMAAILGTVRSFLTALPFLRAFTDQLCAFVKLQEKVGWDAPQPLPPDLHSQLLEVKEILQSWQGRNMEGKTAIRQLHSDASNLGWAGKDLVEGTDLHEFWRDQSGLHINVKELYAALQTVKSLTKPGERVHLGVDNSVAYSYLKKSGGRKPVFNQLMRPFLLWTQSKEISVEVNLVKSADMQADFLSRKAPDKGDYTLQRSIFLQVREIFWPFCQPDLDIFASPGNHQLPKWVSRYPHWGAWEVNALEMCLDKVSHCWANPPWTLIHQWLCRLRLAPWVTCLMAVPLWVGTSWWALLAKMHVKGSPVVLVEPRWGLFQSCQGEMMPPTRWPLLCIQLSGSSWRGNKSQIKVSHYI
jgi:hypothetical protein